MFWAASAAAQVPPSVEGDFVARDFRFASGETLPELRLHYTTLGKPAKDANGVVRNAVLVLHGTGGSGRGFLSETFAGGLFAKGKLLDAERYFIVLPDGIGHGKSSKPSDGLRMRFPRYGYVDMVAAHHRLLTEALGVNHLRLVMGTSMGGMQTWVWGERYPDFMDALMPLASLPTQISGRNRMMRRMVMDPIRSDPEWKNGDYERQPKAGLTAAMYTLLFMTSSPLQWQKRAPTRDAADTFFDEMLAARLRNADANDTLYHFDASRDYDPGPELEKIQAPLVAVNSADDQVNPPELGILEAEIKRVKRGRAVVLPISDATRGHGSHSLPELWKHELQRLLEESERLSKADVQRLIDDRDKARAGGDWARYGSFYTPDASVMMSDGRFQKGRPEIESAARQTFGAGAYKGTRITTVIDSADAVAPGVAIAEVSFEIAGIGGGGSRKGHTTVVLVRQADGWKIAATRSMVPAATGAVPASR